MKENTAKKKIPVTKKVAKAEKVKKVAKAEKVKKVAKVAAPVPVVEEKAAPAVETATVEKTDQAPADAKLCPKCNGYYPGDTCPNCSAETDLPEPPKMKTVYGDIEGPHEAEAAAPATQEEALAFEEPLTGARLDTHNLPKEEPFEPLHLEFSRQVFIEAMKVAMDITEKKSIMPILSHVHLKSDAPNGEYTSCTLEATDLQITWVRRIHGKGDAVNRCIPGKLLMNEIKALPDGANVELTFSRHAVSVNGRCEILTPDAEEFPEIKVNAGV